MADQEDQQLSQADADSAPAGDGSEEASSPPPGGDASERPSQADSDAAAEEPIAAPTPTSQEEEPAEQAAQAEATAEDNRPDSTGKPFDEIAAAMAAEIEEAAQQSQAPAAASSPAAHPPPDLSEATALELDAFQESQGEIAIAQGIGLLSNVELQVKIELGRAQKTVKEVLALGSGSVVELDRLAGDPVDVYVNERLLARGEVLVLNDNLCIRVNEIVSRESGAEVA